MPTPSIDTAALIALRHRLHQYPELSGHERATAAHIVSWLETCAPDQIITGLGGHGVAAIFSGTASGPTVLFRCELDALPIMETGTVAWRSKQDGHGHLCGHDGHMAIMCGLARHLHKNPPKAGRIVLLFQPAEEDGAGARAVIADEKFSSIQPDYAFALHNLPGMPRHHIGIKSGPFNFASEGLAVKLAGRTSHASHPEDGISPAGAISALINSLPQLPQTLGYSTEQALITLVHASLGVKAFGVAPGNGLVMATVRSINNDIQNELMDAAMANARHQAEQHRLSVEFSNGEKFAACTNNAVATAHVERATNALGLPLTPLQKPFRWSEDFGLFSDVCQSALFVLGAGEHHPQLHNPDYDFPDELIPTGVSMFLEIARQLCGEAA